MPFGERILDFICDKTIKELRKGKFVDENLALELSSQPFVDQIRKKLDQDDKEIVMNLINSHSEHLKHFGLALSNAFSRDKEIEGMLFSLWRNSNSDKTKLWVMWTLLNNPKLPLKIHEEMFDFIKANWDTFISQTENWSGGKKNVIADVEERLKNPQIPEEKKWIYLCKSFASDDLQKRKRIFKVYMNSDNSFVRKVAIELQNKF